MFLKITDLAFNKAIQFVFNDSNDDFKFLIVYLTLIKTPQVLTIHFNYVIISSANKVNNSVSQN